MSERIYLRYPGKDETVAVAIGFSWGACLLGFVWALSKKMWFAAFVMLAINCCCSARVCGAKRPT